MSSQIWGQLDRLRPSNREKYKFRGGSTHFVWSVSLQLNSFHFLFLVTDCIPSWIVGRREGVRPLHLPESQWREPLHVVQLAAHVRSGRISAQARGLLRDLRRAPHLLRAVLQVTSQRKVLCRFSGNALRQLPHQTRLAPVFAVHTKLIAATLVERWLLCIFQPDLVVNLVALLHR